MSGKVNNITITFKYGINGRHKCAHWHNQALTRNDVSSGRLAKVILRHFQWIIKTDWYSESCSSSIIQGVTEEASSMVVVMLSVRDEIIDVSFFYIGLRFRMRNKFAVIEQHSQK